MKTTMIAMGLTAAVLASQVKPAEARDCGSAVAGAVIGGVVLGAVLADACAPRTVYVAPPAYCPPPAPVVYAPTPVYCPPPRVVYVPAPRMVVYREPVRRYSYWGGLNRGRNHGRDFDDRRCR